MLRSNSPIKPTNTNPSYPTTPLRNPALSQLALDVPEVHISPTKAAAVDRLNHNITTLQIWLESLFHPSPVPAHFLRWRDEVLSSSAANLDGGLISNDDNPFGGSPMGTSRTTSTKATGGNDVLEALKALKQANLSADHLKRLVHEAQVEELRWLDGEERLLTTQREEGVPARVLLDDVYAALERFGHEALVELSKAAIVLGIDLDEGNCGGSNAPYLSQSFVQGLLEQVTRSLWIAQQARKLEVLTTSLTQEITGRGGNGNVSVSDHRTKEESTEKIRIETAQFNRDTKQIKLKIMEYEDRVKGLERQLSSLPIDSARLGDVVTTRRQVSLRRIRITKLQNRLQNFHGLPPDLEASRSEIKRAIGELETLKRRREGLFEKIGHV